MFASISAATLWLTILLAQLDDDGATTVSKSLGAAGSLDDVDERASTRDGVRSIARTSSLPVPST